MHSCLTINEILHLIFEHLFEAPWALTRLARVCHTFTEPALNVLWRAQCRLAPVIQVMPQDLWTLVDGRDCYGEEEGMPYSMQIVRFNRELNEADWVRFDYYASKIRELGRCFVPDVYRFQAGDVAVHEVALASLCACRPGSMLFPNLSKISYNLADRSISKSLHFTPSVVGPTIEQIWFECPGPNAEPYVDFPSLFSSLVELCPNVRVLRLIVRLTPIPQSWADEVYRLAPNLPKLEALYAAMLSPDPEAVVRLGNLPYFRSWTYATMHEMPPSVFSHFMNLRRLEIHVQDWNAAAALVNYMRSPLESLIISEDPHSPKPDSPPYCLGMFTDSLSRHSSFPSTLTYFCLKGLNPAGSTPSCFTPLFSLSNIQTIKLEFDSLPQLDDSWLHGAAAAWPRLRHLQVDELKWPLTTKFTLKGLIPLIKQCPHLHTISVNPIAEPFDVALFPPGIINRMKTFDVSVRPPATIIPEKIFECLLLIFPELGWISSYDVPYEQQAEWDVLCNFFQERLDRR